ncbi:MAG: hypothetical protein ABEJ08_03705 [Halobacteriaceae archaeon]
MPSTSRRSLLASGAAALTTLSGCASRGVETDPPERTHEAVQHPPAVTVRGRGNEPVASIDPATTDRPDADPRHRGLVASEADADRLSITVEDGATRARSFLAETDFDSETVVLDGQEVRQCFDHDICWVTWTASTYRTFYVRRYRPWDVACERGERDYLAHLIRIPAALDPAAMHSDGRGWSTGDCRWPPWLDAPADETTSTTGGRE